MSHFSHGIISILMMISKSDIICKTSGSHSCTGEDFSLLVYDVMPVGNKDWSDQMLKMKAAARHSEMSVNYLPVNKHHIRDEQQGTLKCQLTIYQLTSIILQMTENFTTL
jgi:hypothetical protein